MEAAVIPFPNPESTPPVTNTYLVGRFATIKVPLTLMLTPYYHKLLKIRNYWFTHSDAVVGLKAGLLVVNVMEAWRLMEIDSEFSALNPMSPHFLGGLLQQCDAAYGCSPTRIKRVITEDAAWLTIRGVSPTPVCSVSIYFLTARAGSRRIICPLTEHIYDLLRGSTIASTAKCSNIGQVLGYVKLTPQESNSHFFAVWCMAVWSIAKMRSKTLVR